MGSAEISPRAVTLSRAALGHVLDIDGDHLRADTPLADIGADSVAVIVFADVAERLAREQLGIEIEIDNETLRTARTVGDLAAAIPAAIA